jgi:hypothetical protein
LLELTSPTAPVTTLQRTAAAAAEREKGKGKRERRKKEKGGMKGGKHRSWKGLFCRVRTGYPGTYQGTSLKGVYNP